MAAIFMLLFILMGVSTTFKKSLAVTIWGTAPPTIIITILSSVFMLVKDPEDLDISPANNVVSNLSGLVTQSAHPALSSLLGSIDIFSLWTIALLSLGFAAISNKKLTAGKAATGIVILWIIWVIGKAGYHALLG
jgi:hypothetical protein